MADPRVTVLMSVYNGERFLKPAVDSILNQTFSAFVFLILNDGSRDKTAKILEGYDDPRLRVLENRENLGLAKSLNRGLGIAETEYIARMDADDISHPDRLLKQIRYLDENPDVGLLGTRYVGIDEDGREWGEIYVPIGSDNIKRNLLVRNSFCHGSVVFRKSVIERAGCYNEDITVAQDYDLWLRVAEICPVENYPEVLHKWRVNEQTGISVTRFSEQEQMALAIREGHLRRKIENGSEEFPNLMQLALAHPLDQLIAQIAMEEFEKSTGAVEDFRIHVRKLGYLHKDPKHPYLNQVARYYADMGKKGLAFMCLVESLKHCPEQPEILELAERFRRCIEPVIPKRLPDDTCTVSVIMPTYNRTREIRESILSVLNQTFKDLELIVVNDGGTDEVKNIIDSFNSSSIKYYKIKTNKGLSGALNEGLNRANGRYIAYLDDDDIYYPNHIETLVDLIEKNPDFDCVYSHAWWCYGESVEDTFVEHYRNLNYRPEKFDRAVLGESNYISTLNILHSKRCLTKAGLFNEDLGKLMDWDLWMRLSKFFNFHQIDAVTGEYRWKQNNMSVEDRLDVEFLYRIVKTFYESCEGRVVFATAYMAKGMRERAEDIFDEIVDGYDGWVKTPSLVRAVFDLSRLFPRSLTVAFQIKLARDFFDANPRVCLKVMLSRNLWYLLLVCVDLLLLRTCRSVKYRVSKRLRSFIKRSDRSDMEIRES